jgi:hypothetical protein
MIADYAAKARRLRHLAVDKGLLREVKAIQKMLDSLVVCRVSLNFQYLRYMSS